MSQPLPQPTCGVAHGTTSGQDGGDSASPVLPLGSTAERANA